MNLFSLIFKQMRQRALGTWLTTLSVMLGVALAVVIVLIQQAGTKIFYQSDFGYDLIVGPAKGSPLQLVLNTVYGLDRSPGTVQYGVFEQIRANRQVVRRAVPIAVGDTVEGLPVIGTTPALFAYGDDGTRLTEAYFSYRKNKRHELAEGRMFHPEKFEAIVGSEVLKRLGKKIGDTFQITHGNPTEGAAKDIHEEKWTIVGTLAKTGTAADRGLYIPLISFYAIPEHEDALEQMAKLQGIVVDPNAPPPATTAPAEDDHDHAGHDHAGHDHSKEEPKPSAEGAAAAAAHSNEKKDDHAGHDHAGHDHAGHSHETAYHLHGDLIHLELPKEKWQLSAILVETRSPPLAMSLQWAINNRPEASAVNPASVMREFFSTFLAGTTRVMLLLSVLITIVAAVGILVSIYNSVAARTKEIAILRALGATKSKVLAVVVLEAATVGMVGAALGLAGGIALGAIASGYLQSVLGEGFNYLALGVNVWYYLAGTVVLSAVAGLVPALKAYQVPVATNLNA